MLYKCKKMVNLLNKIKRRPFIAGLLLVTVLLIPTGDPTDIFITIPLISFIGIQNFLIIASILLFLLLINEKEIRQMI